jgi:hypothetical protein
MSRLSLNLSMRFFNRVVVSRKYILLTSVEDAEQEEKDENCLAKNVLT